MSLVEFFSQPVWHRLGLTLVHFLWQGLAVAVLVYAAVRILRLKRGNPRYAAYLVAFAVMAASPLLTFLVLDRHVPLTVTAPEPAAALESSGPLARAVPTAVPAQLPEDPLPVSSTYQPSLRARLDRALQNALPWALVGWMGGVLMLSVRLLLGFLGVYRWRRQVEPLPEGLEARIVRLSERLGLPGFARVFASHRAREVVALGYLRPMVLLPATLVTQMPPEMLEAVIAHELAHIRRLDLWVNLAQRVVETLLFYHPAVWWLSSRLRSERELCCDEVAVQATGERLTYASALETAGRTRWAARQPLLALELGQDRRSTLGRVRHVLGLPPSPPDSRFWLAGIVTVALLALLALPAVSVLTAKAGAQVRTDDTGADLIFGNATTLGPTVNRSTNEFDPSISADGLELYFNSGRPGGLGQTDLWVATRKTRTDPWAEPINLGPTVNSPAGDKAPCISADGLSLYFSSDRPGGSGGLDLWVTTRQTRTVPWGEPVNLGPPVNSTADEHSPSISTDGLTLYFAEHTLRRPGGYGSGDIWVTTRKTKHDPWDTPVNLGPTVNSSAWDQAPSISDDGLTLYFDSEVSGGSDLWMTTRKTTSDPWGAPIKLSPVVNADWEANPDISRDGSTLYFASTRPGGVGGVDIWQATRVKSTPESRAQAQLAASLGNAVKAGDLEQVRLLLSKGAGVSAKDEQGRTPLHWAAWYGRGEVAELLIAKAADVNETDASRQTPLHLAADFGGTLVPELLLAKGAQIDARDNAGNTPLHAAADFPSVGKDLLELLIAKGADVKARNEAGQTPLHRVSMIRRLDKRIELTAQVLLAHGAEVDAKDESGRTPLHFAVENGNQKLVDVLVAKGADLEAKNAAGATALHLAAANGRSDLVELLVNRGANVNSIDSERRTPLHYASRRGNNETAERLIAKGAEVNAKAAHGETPAQLAILMNRNHKDTVTLLLSKGAAISSIQLAAYLGDLARVEAFLENGVGVNTQDPCSPTPLHAAAMGGQKEVAEFLLSKGALVNTDFAALRGAGARPLQYAAFAGSKGVAELLIQKGAEIDAKNKDGLTALHYAVSGRDIDTARLLIAQGADVNAKLQGPWGWTPLHYGAYYGAKDLVLLLLDHGADINAQTANGTMPSMMAAQRGHEDVVRLLIDKGAALSNRDGLLFWACRNQQKDLAELLIRKGANVNSKAWGDDAPLALETIHGGYTNATKPADIPRLRGVLEVLLDHGADPDAKDRWDWSLLHYTCEEFDLAKLLLDKGANPNAVENERGLRPLHLAADEGRTAAVELLISRGADVNAKDYSGRTALWYAEDLGDNDMFGRPRKTPLTAEAKAAKQEVTRILREHGAKE
jgi:ankyrin repeat protein/beta-lactamase regulating signal transducer with metallopeptidase domain/Tol biopolymer transport system component